MAKKVKSVGQEIVAGLQEAVRHMKGEQTAARVHVVHVPDVKSLRRRLGYSQSEFARKFGLNVRTVQDWEQKRAAPDPAARSLLAVIDHSPRVAERAIRKTAGRAGPT